MLKRLLFLMFALGLIVLVVTGTLRAQVTVTTSNSYYATAENAPSCTLTAQMGWPGQRPLP